MKQPQQTPVSAPMAYPSPTPVQGQFASPQIPPQLVASQQAPMQMQQPHYPVQQPNLQAVYPPMGGGQTQHQMPVPPVHMQQPAQHLQQQAPITAPAIDSVKEGGEKALPRIAIHAFCDRGETAGAIQAMSQDWRMARTNLKVYMGGLNAAIEYYRNETTPSLVMVESGLRGPELLSWLDELASVVAAGTKVVLIGAVNDIRLYRELMDKGVSDYLVPPFNPLALIRSISDLYSDPDKPFIGRVVAFYGAKGGVGSSTLSHNIAWGLANELGQETALVDMDSSWGTTGLDFNYDSTQGLEEALADSERLDETLLDKIMVRHTDKLSILPASASLGSAASISTEAYETLVDGVRSLSPLTILDMPHVWTDWTKKLLISADDVVITANPDLANLRNTKNLVDFLKAARPNDAPPLLVLNKTGVPKTAEIPV
ncbi:MAG: AAA family ATPase, partial [Robiginitomaculum sp.]|nr:AAA family ATPase [Robiginitomaculum sp.]